MHFLGLGRPKYQRNSWIAHGFHEKSKLLRMFPLQRRGWKTLESSLWLFANCRYHTQLTRSGSRKKYLGGLAPHHLGGNNEKNYCVQLSSIKQLMYNVCTVITLKIGGQDFGGLWPPGPNIEPPLQLMSSWMLSSIAYTVLSTRQTSLGTYSYVGTKEETDSLFSKFRCQLFYLQVIVAFRKFLLSPLSHLWLNILLTVKIKFRKLLGATQSLPVLIPSGEGTPLKFLIIITSYVPNCTVSFSSISYKSGRNLR